MDSAARRESIISVEINTCRVTVHGRVNASVTGLRPRAIFTGRNGLSGNLSVEEHLPAMTRDLSNLSPQSCTTAASRSKSS